MARRPTKVSEKRETIRLGDLIIPVRIITERGRANVRASVTQKALIIRVPADLPSVERERRIREMHRWAMKTYERKPEAFTQFTKQELASRYRLTVRGTDYQISVQPAGGKSHTIRHTGPEQLLIGVNAADPRLERGVIIPRLLSKFFSGWYLPQVTARVEALNAEHFQRPYHRVRMKDTVTRWGSCSNQGNLNLSSRLLLAPDAVLDAVIIHELAHLVEANHSPRFWAEVERALPNYRQYDAWLREHGRELSFQPEPVG